MVEWELRIVLERIRNSYDWKSGVKVDQELGWVGRIRRVQVDRKFKLGQGPRVWESRED
jgi:hypothetical protein